MTPSATTIRTGTVLAPFQGERDATGPLTEGQLATLRWSRNMTEGGNYIMDFDVRPPDGTTVSDVAAVFGVLLSRYEALRTTYLIGTPPVQRVIARGELAIEVHELPGDSRLDDHAAATAELTRRLRAQGLDSEHDLPLRVALGTEAGAVRLVVVLISHMAVDLSGWLALRWKFLRLLGDPTTRTVSRGMRQPLDQAATESSVSSQRLRIIQRYWEDHLRRSPQVLYAVSADERGRGSALRGVLRSAAALHAVPHIMARTAGSLQMAVLAAVAAVLARRSGQRLCPVQVYHHARTRRTLRDYIGTLAVDVSVFIDQTVGGFDELVRRTGAATLAGSWQTAVATEARAAQRIGHERGVDFARDCAFNNVTGVYRQVGRPILPDTPATVVAGLRSHTTVDWTEADPLPELMLFRLTRAKDVLELGLVTGDSHRVPQAEVESLLRAIEHLLVSAAIGDADLDHLLDTAGVTPIERSPNWSYVDGCWIEAGAVQRLVDDAVTARVARTFVVPDEQGRPAVVAYLVAGDRIRTPEQAHAACMAALADRHTAMTPGRYVFCEQGPPDVTSLADWQRCPVLVAGSGRTGGRPWAPS